MASQIESFEVQLTSNLVLLLVGEINFWCPVYTNNMGPDVLLLINAPHDSLNLVTKEALDILALELLVGIQLGAPLAVPSSIWNFVGQISSIASLMHGDIAKLANDNIIAIFILELKAYITLNILVIIVIWDLNCIVSILLFLLLFLLSEFIPSGHLGLFSGHLVIALYDMRLHHDVPLNVIIHVLVHMLGRAGLSTAHWVEHGISAGTRVVS
jgi:hypothetical protein